MFELCLVPYFELPCHIEVFLLVLGYTFWLALTEALQSPLTTQAICRPGLQFIAVTVLLLTYPQTAADVGVRSLIGLLQL